MINRPIIIILKSSLSSSLLMLSKHARGRLLHRHWGSSSSLMAAASYYSSSSSSLVTGNNNNKGKALSNSNSNSNSKGLILFHHLRSFSSSAVNPNNPSPITTALPLYLASRGCSVSTSFDSSIIGTTPYSLRLINWRRKGFKGCRCSNNHSSSSSSSINNEDDDDISNNTNTLHKARLHRPFAPSLPHLLSHSQKPRLEQDDNRDANDVVTQNGAYRTIGFPNQPAKIVVAVDVDEVLGNFLSALNSFIADRYSSNHSFSEYHVYEFFKIWNCSRDEADIRVHEFFKTSYFKAGINPIPGARQALQKLSRFCNLSVVTSRQNAIKDHTIEWIEKHYPSLFQGIHFGNHFALDGQSRPKSDICRSLGADILIDDNPRYAIECAEAGIRVLLFDYENSYPWCKTESVTRHPLVTKVHNWGEVEHRLVSRTFS